MCCQTDITCDTMEIHEKKKVIGLKTFQKKCIETLLNVTIITKLITMLSNAGCLGNFVQLVTHISEGTMSCMNISLLLCLNVPKLHSCITRTAMHFRKETKQFWEVVYKVCKGKDLCLFSGSKSRGCLQSKSMKRGSYDPASSNHNFAVPDVKSLIRNSGDILNLVFPGILVSAIKMLDKSKQYILSVNGKKIAAAL